MSVFLASSTRVNLLILGFVFVLEGCIRGTDFQTAIDALDQAEKPDAADFEPMGEESVETATESTDMDPFETEESEELGFDDGSEDTSPDLNDLPEVTANDAAPADEAGDPGLQDTCIPDCAGRECGVDGCGGECGFCDFGIECSSAGRCLCEDECPEDGASECIDPGHYRTCGGHDDDDCLEWGTAIGCEAPATCSSGACACTPSCGSSDCGDDGCGGDCGLCSGGAECVSGHCTCISEHHVACCGEATCWFDSCGSQEAQIEACPYGCLDGSCSECLPGCEGFECGPDRCGGVCGECPLSPRTCQQNLCNGLFQLPDPERPSTEFTDNGDGTVTDTVTELTWEQVDVRSVNWEQAFAHCQSKGTSWRLPTRLELMTLVDHGKQVKPLVNGPFSGEGLSYGYFFWSSTPSGAAPASMGTVNFDSGYGGYSDKGASQAVRCVR